MEFKYRQFLILIFAFPNIIFAQDINWIGYEDMTPAAKSAVDMFIKDYGRAAEEKLASLGEDNARFIAKRLKETMKQEYRREYTAANETEIKLYNENPDSTLLLARMAAIHYNRGVSAYGDVTGNFKKTVEYSEKCLRIEPENGECWFFYGAGLGEYITRVGIFQTISHIKKVHDAFEKALRLTSDDPFPFGPLHMNSKSAAYIGLTQFYRMCPDWWIMQLIAGILGDKQKAYEYSKEIKPVDFDRANIRARTAFCYGASVKNMEIIEEGKAIIREAATYDLVNPLHAYVKEQILMLNRLFEDHKNLGIKDYYKIGCYDVQRPDEL